MINFEIEVQFLESNGGKRCSILWVVKKGSILWVISKYSILGVIIKKILRVILKEQNLWVMFMKEVQFFESHSKKGSNLWVINQKKSSILLGRKSEKKINSLIFSKKRSIYSLSQTFFKKKIFFESHLKKRFNFFESCWKEGFNFYESCWKEGLGHVEKKGSILRVIFFKIVQFYDLCFQKSSILWVLFSKSSKFFESYFQGVQFFESYFQKVFSSLSHIFHAFNSLNHILQKKRSILWVIFCKKKAFN